MNGERQVLVKCVTKTADASIKLAAEQKKDEALLCQIRDIDLVAREAHYHNHCRRAYTRNQVRHSGSADSETLAVLEAHRKAFELLCYYIQENIIAGMKVERMTMLRERYLLYLMEADADAYNENYKTDKLKDKMKNRFGTKIRFWRPSSKGKLVYSDEILKGQAVEAAFESACSDEKRIEETALILRRHVLDAKNSSGDIPFLPTASWLLSDQREPPHLLKDFLSHLVTGNPNHKISAKSLRFINSCSQDTCYATTSEQWEMPKHILLAMTVHHLTGSAQIITLLNRLGHCQSYTRTLELETALCNSVTARTSLLPAGISTEHNEIIHFCWDNFDLNEETPSGSGTTHTAHGIAIQEVENGAEVTDPDLPNVSESHRRTADLIIDELEPCFAKAKAEPNFNVTKAVPETCDFSDSMLSDFLWIFARKQLPQVNQSVPSWAGWPSATSDNQLFSEFEPRNSTVAYMAPVLFPITENATVQHVLEVSKKATQSVGQEYTIVTSDLGVAQKAFNIVWQNHVKFGKVIIRIGVFHTICSLFGAIGKHIKGSGFEDIIIEAGVCASGSLQKVMSGKHYNRALRVHKLMLEALERLLYEAFINHEESTEALSDETQDAVNQLSVKPDSEKFANVTAREDFRRLYHNYSTFKDSIRKGSFGKTAQFWIGYMDLIWLILTFIRATKENNYNLHLATLYKLCPMFFAYNHQNYSCYIPAYLVTMTNLPDTHPGAEDLISKKGFSVSRSGVPVSRNPVDITIEQTINRHAKSHGGIIGFSRNIAAYYRWCVTRHSRAQYVEATLDMADMTASEASAHKELRVSQMQNSENNVKKITEAVLGFTNPFQVENKEELYCLSSGIPATQEVSNSLLQALELGKDEMVTFFEKWLVHKSVKFQEPIQRMKIKTFASMQTSQKIKSTQSKLIEVRAERNVFAQLVLLSLKNNIDLEIIMSYQLGPVP